MKNKDSKLLGGYSKLMPENVTRVNVLRESITDEACKAIGFKSGSWQWRIFSGLFWVPAQRFSKMAAEFDNHIEKDGVTAALRWMVPRFASKVEVYGAENIPADGPLLVVSNHPGAFDGIVILAQFHRDDIKMIVSDVIFTRGLQAGSKHMIYSSGDDAMERMNAVRQSVRHLQRNGLLMLFPTGLVDPDPSFMPGAEQALEGWSASLEYFVRKVPETRILPTIISGVIAPKYLNNPLARRQRTVRSRQKVAEYLEMAQLMIVQRDLGLTPQISFGRTFSLAEQAGSVQQADFMQTIVAEARKLLSEHKART
jgi:hypothetical protein